MQRETSSVSRRNLKSEGKAVIINTVTSGAVAQLGEHQAGSLRVVGSNPTGSTFVARVAELAYALDLGSSPPKAGAGSSPAPRI